MIWFYLAIPPDISFGFLFTTISTSTAQVDVMSLKTFYDTDTGCQKCLSCVHFKLRSGRNKQDELDYFFSEAQVRFDVVMISETWFASEEEVFAFPMYKSYYMNRTGERGGGVAMLISDLMSSELTSDFCSTTPYYETLAISIVLQFLCLLPTSVK